MSKAGIDGYVINARRTLSSGRRVELDVLWEGRKRVIEIDGERYHGAVTARARDAQRDRELEADGYRVLRVTASDVDDEAAYVERVRRFLREPSERDQLRAPDVGVIDGQVGRWGG